MACIRALRSPQGSTDDLHKQQATASKKHMPIIQVYTDWANHYLCRTRSKRLIHDLQTDVCDGVLLADIIEAVTNQSVPNINQKPKTSSQMIENIRACLACLAELGVNVDGVQPEDVRHGNLKAILGIFFSLSRHKQQQKHRHPDSMPRIPSAISKHGSISSSSIPMPAGSRLSGIEDTRQPAVPLGVMHHQPQGGTFSSAAGSTCSSRSTSPSSSAHSLIPTAARACGPHDKHLPNARVRSGTPSSSTTTSPSSPRGSSVSQRASTEKNSVLGSLKLFSYKDKGSGGGGGGGSGRAKGGGTNVSKRTSSSSGFSSARSERSDSSTSLCSDVKPCPSSAPQDEKLDADPALSFRHHSSDDSCPKGLSRGFKNKLVKGIGVGTSKDVSPGSPKSRAKLQTSKSSPKFVRKSGISRENKGESVHEHQKAREDSVLRSTYGEHKMHGREMLNSDNYVYDTVAGDSENVPKQAKFSNVKTDHAPSKVRGQSVSVKTSSSSGYNMSRATPAPPCTLGGGGPGSSIPKPTAAVKGTSKPAKEERNQVASPMKQVVVHREGLPRQKHLGAPRESDMGGSISVALVSPMPSVTASENSSSMSESSYSNSTGQSNSNSSDSSVIYRPSSESGSEMGKPVSRKIETTFDSLDKVITQESPHVQPRETSFGEEEATMNVKPMQPLLRGYTGGLTSSGPNIHMSCMGMQNKQSMKCFNYAQHLDPMLDIKRGVGDGGYGDPDYSNIEVVSGYLSDGDMLRSSVSHPLSDLCDGYMSEGGASLVARRLHSQQIMLQDNRNSGGISPSQGKSEPLQRRAVTRPKPRTNLDDNKSASSGVSETFAELSADEHLPGHSHNKRLVQGGPGGCLKGPVSQKSLPTSFSPSDQTQVVYRVVGSRSHVKKSDSSQQTDNSAFRQSSGSQAKKHAESNGNGGGRVPELHRGKTDPEVVRQQRGDKRGSGSSPGASSNGLARKPDKNADRQKKMGVKEDGTSKEKEYCNNAEKQQSKTDRSSPHSSSGLRTNGEGKQSKVRGVPQSFGYVKRSTNGCTGNKNELRTAQVSAVPRTKLKVSGGTQTCTSDLQQPPQQQQQQPQHHHYKSYSLTGPSASQLSQSVRDRLLLGSQSLPKPGSSEHAALFHSHRSQQRAHRPTDGSLSDTTYSNYADLQNYYANSSPYSSWLRYSATYTSSLPARASAAGLVEADSVESLCSLPAQLQHHRASLTHARLLMHQRESSASPGPRLNRSNSIRFNYSPITTSASSHGLSRISISPYSGLLSKTNSKDDEIHGSSVSLVSTASSLYSTPEEKQSHEIRKLRRELQDAQEKVHTLTNQLSTNAHVVSAFEQSLSNMTQRLQHLTSTAERKDSELLELRQTIELLRKQSVEAGLTSAHIQSMSPSLARRHTINVNAGAPAGGSNMLRQLSTDSVSSINSLSSACSLSSSAHAPDSSTTSAGKKKKKGWLRSSFSKAFSRSKKNKNGSVSDVEDSRGLSSDVSAPSSPLLNAPHHMNGSQIKGSQSSSAIYDKEPHEARPDVVEELKKQLREKDLVLTDIRLEALSSAHQLESLKDTVIKMRNEMLNLKQDNERLQRIVTSKSLTSSQSSLPITDSLERRFSMTETSTPPPTDPDGKRVVVSVFLGSHGSYHKYIEESNTPSYCVIAALFLSGKTKWDMLDCLIRRAFKEYVLRVDPVSNLGLSAESIWSYHIGEVVRYKDSQVPELLPYGYLVGDSQNSIHVCLKGALHSGSVDALAFETLIPKSIVQRYVSLLSEHRRIILCGPSGTGKSYLANKLAEFLVLRDGKESTAESIATFNVDHKSSKELRQYLANVAEQCENNASDLPSVIILDNLHHAASLGEVFNGFLNAKYSKCPYIIGTMNQATCSTTNLQLHHNFRWVLCANHMEPVKGFLGRFLRRRLLEAEVQEGVRNNDLNRIFDWIPKVWQHLNKFLETHSSSDVTIGPRLFLSCPSDPDGSQVWFTDLWNYSVVPYLLEAVREGLQLYGRRAPWEDPTHFICQTYPWTGDTVQGGQEALLRLRPEDVGYDIQQSGGVGGSSIKSMSSTQSDTDGDPLLNMLMRLQEAANYSSPHSSNDSDAISIDSHPSSIHSDDKGNSRVESAL
ncbi:protein sickie isoform X2 [Periplaneta americana]|uniref:protein sickie isoform X2 n=1 Tax=Periplaneta americana TaxID=6978 RepID=UPI0037E74F25